MNLECAAFLTNDKAFVFGAVVGILLTMVLWTYSTYMRTKYLIEKGEAEFRTAAKLGGKFYYIVPETEYVQRELVQLCRGRKIGDPHLGAPELDQYRSAIEDGEKKQKD